MAVRLAVISDIHFDQEDAFAAPPPDMLVSDVLLERSVDVVNRVVRPDLTFIAGDFVERGDTPTGRACLERLHGIVDAIDGVVLAVPGNHDDPAVFRELFGDLPDFIDLNGVRFVPFVDVEEPGFNAKREPAEMDHMAQAGLGFDGPLVALQHFSLFPPGMSECPYNFTNAEAVIESMRDNGYVLAITGHYHEGLQIIRKDDISFIAAPTLRKEPFPFLEVTIDNDDITITEHNLRDYS